MYTFGHRAEIFCDKTFVMSFSVLYSKYVLKRIEVIVFILMLPNQMTRSLVDTFSQCLRDRGLGLWCPPVGLLSFHGGQKMEKIKIHPSRFSTCQGSDWCKTHPTVSHYLMGSYGELLLLKELYTLWRWRSKHRHRVKHHFRGSLNTVQRTTSLFCPLVNCEHLFQVTGDTPMFFQAKLEGNDGVLVFHDFRKECFYLSFL